MEHRNSFDVAASLAAARAAHASGSLAGYKPLETSGVGYEYGVTMVSWGPLMKR